MEISFHFVVHIWWKILWWALVGMMNLRACVCNVLHTWACDSVLCMFSLKSNWVFDGVPRYRNEFFVREKPLIGIHKIHGFLSNHGYTRIIRTELVNKLPIRMKFTVPIKIQRIRFYIQRVYLFICKSFKCNVF